MSKHFINQEKFDNVYMDLVDETENPETYDNQYKTRLLGDLLDLFEYLMDNTDENPVDDWFE